MKKFALIKSIICSVLLVAFCFCIFTIEVGTVATGSMIPNINVGESVLYWKLFPLKDVKVGDVVVYQPRDNFLVVHRVSEVRYSIENDKAVRRLQVKGDNNLFADSTLVDKSNYVGKVFHIIKKEKANSLVKAMSNINAPTRAGIVLIIMALWTIVINFKPQKHDTATSKKKKRAPTVIVDTSELDAKLAEPIELKNKDIKQ